MCRVYRAILFFGALMMINVGIAFGAHEDFFEDQSANQCFEETVKVKNGADPESLSTIYCKRALRVEPLSREDRSAILYNRGIIQRAQGDLMAAQASFRQAVRLSKTVDRRNLALAEVARDIGDYRVALEQYDLLIESGFAIDSEDVWVAVLGRRQEIGEFPSYFASMLNKTVAPGVTKVASFDKAQACASCHGAGGVSINPERPTLAGQREDYLEHALRQYRNGERQHAEMTAQARQISEEDILVLARYFASLDGL